VVNLRRVHESGQFRFDRRPYWSDTLFVARKPEDAADPPPGVVRWLISIDETGVNGTRHYGFGSLWMSWQRRGDFAALVERLRAEHRYHDEIKWTRIKRGNVGFYGALVKEFFTSPWLQFHCILVEKAVVRKELHKGDWDLARRKHLTLLITNKVARCAAIHRRRPQTFRVWTDSIHSRYSKADEAMEIISEHVLREKLGKNQTLDGVYTHDSKDKPSIQLSDLLVGAVVAAREGDMKTAEKQAIVALIAEHLGWPDLKADTRPEERKFNVWVFYDPTRGKRREKTRDVTLRFPLPSRRK
jgi:hypothetical protein